MTVTYRATATVAAGNSPRTVTKPTGTAENDLLLLHVAMSLDGTPTVPSGFTLIHASAEVTGTYNIRIYGKTAGASEQADYTVTESTPGNSIACGMTAIYSSDAKPLSLNAVGNQTNASGDRIWPSISPTKTTSLYLGFATLGANASSTPPGGSDERYDISGLPRIYLLTESLASSGATGTRTATGVSAANKTVAVAYAELDLPTAPSGLSATAISTSQIDLSWTDNSSNETGFEIERSPDGSSGWTLIDTNTAGDTTYSNTGLSEHTQYYYRVKAVNADGSSSYTSTANATTLIAPPTDLSATAISASRIDLGWTDNSGVEDGYKIERSPNGSTGWTEIDTVGAGVTTYQNTGLTSNTTYYYRVRAYDGSDNSTYSNTANALTPLQTPTSLAVAQRLSTKLRITWSDSNSDEDGFKLERSPAGAGTWAQIATPTASPYDDTGLSANTAYDYRIRAYDGSNHSAYSSTATGTTYATLVAPTAFAATPASATSITLSWSNSNSGVTAYSLERSLDGEDWAEVATPSASPYTNSGLNPNTTYFYRIRAYRDGSIEYGPYSSEESATTQAIARHARLFLLDPAIVFSARINLASATYPIDSLPYDGVVDGDYTDVRVGMTVLIGSTLYGDDLGRTRVRAAPDSDTLPIGRSSRGTRDGEITATDNAYITVLDDFRVWAKIPYITSDGTINKDSDLAYSDQTSEPPPVANTGPGFAATIDPITELITVAFDGSASFATAAGATITGYAWDLKDYDTVTAGALDEDSVTATFPAGFRWIALTVTDSNGKTHTAWAPIYARDPADDGQVGGCIPHFHIESHRITPQGQEIAFRIRHDIDTSDYPDGTLAMFWYGEPANASDRSHMQFIGWHQTDPAELESSRTATLMDTTLNCVDVAGRLDTLPGFPQILEADDTPSNWTQMADPTINRYLHYLLLWHSTALEVADWSWAEDGDDYVFLVLGSDGESLWNQIDRRAKGIVPDHLITCNRRGQLATLPDPMLLDTGDRPATVQASIAANHYQDLRYTHNRPPRIHWLRASAILADEDEVSAIFTQAPGTAPGQGERAQDHGEQLALSQTDLNAVTGHRYARINAPQGLFSLTLLGSDDLSLDPAALEWVELTIASPAQRGLSFTDERGLVQSMAIRWASERGGLVRTISLEWEREISGDPALTVVPPEAEPVDDGDNWTPPPVVIETPIENPISSGQNVVGMIDKLGQIFLTANFQSSPPTWADNLAVATNFTSANEIYSFVVDPFSPGYRGTGTEINGYVATEDGIWKIEDMFNEAGCTATELYTFADSLSDAFGGYRTIAASFGRYQEVETDNPWLICATHYNDAPGTPGGTTIVYSTDAGQTWSSEITITSIVDDYGTVSAAVVHAPALWLSPRTPGFAIVAAYDNTGDPEVGGTYYTTDWGATWAIWTDTDNPGVTEEPSIEPGDILGGVLHFPWPDNEDEHICYYGRQQHGPGGLNYLVIRSSATPGESLTMSLDGMGTDWGPRRGLFGLRTYDNDRRYVVCVGFNNAVAGAPDQLDDTAGVFVSNDYGNTWTMIYGPLTADSNDRYPVEAAFASDDPNVIYIWESERYVSATYDFGATTPEDKTGNLHDPGLATSIQTFVGFFGGPLA